ncbi:thiamine pyrophosphate-binding protein [Microbacterium trichothecenolyticum]|uniref:thiamine pyrophosphate-binding protein n=1 Tax=Microbacterium trichothecenolyticum TaxID=69370 RepID=UPI0035BE9D8D
MASVSAHVAITLAQHVDHVFGVMGNGNAYFLDALERETRATYTALRHEAGAVVAADAHYRVSGSLAAATTTYGAGFTNTLTALAEATQAQIPLVLVVGDEPTSGPRAWDVDQIALAAACGARTYTVRRTDAAATTVIAVEHAMKYRVPTVLAIPYDVARSEAGAVPGSTRPELPVPVALADRFSEDNLYSLAGRLAEAERPLVIAGRGAFLAGAADQLGRLAASVGALTATTALARSIFPDSTNDLGVVGGFGAEKAMRLVRQADVVVVFGASLNQFTMRFGGRFAPGTYVAQVDIRPAATHPHVGAYIQGDARLVAGLLADQVQRLDHAHGGWRGSVDVEHLCEREDADEYAPDGRLDPRAVARGIAEHLPANRVVVSDGGHFIGWANMYWPVASPERMVMVGTAYQSIGFGFPSVPGAALAKPDATVVLTTGDGGGLMALADLESAVRVAGGRGLAIVWNDGAYGAEVNLYGLLGLSETPMLIPEVDFAGLARAVGAHGVVVESLDDLKALQDWSLMNPEDRPFLLLDVRISARVVAPHQREIVHHLNARPAIKYA